MYLTFQKHEQIFIEYNRMKASEVPSIYIYHQIKGDNNWELGFHMSYDVYDRLAFRKI